MALSFAYGGTYKHFPIIGAENSMLYSCIQPLLIDPASKLSIWESREKSRKSSLARTLAARFPRHT